MSHEPTEYRTAPLATGVGEGPAFVPLSAEQRAEIKRLAEAATPGPWRTDGFSSVLTVAETAPVYDWSKPLGAGKYPLIRHESAAIAHLNDGEYIENPNSQEDAAYFAAIPPEITLGTLAYIEQLEAENARLTTQLQEAEGAKEKLVQETHRWSKAEKRDKARHQAELNKLSARLTEELATGAEAKERHRVEVLDILRDMRLAPMPAQPYGTYGYFPEYRRGVNEERQKINTYCRTKAYEYSPEGIGPDPTKPGEWNTLPAPPPHQEEGEKEVAGE